MDQIDMAMDYHAWDAI